MTRVSVAPRGERPSFRRRAVSGARFPRRLRASARHVLALPRPCRGRAPRAVDPGRLPRPLAGSVVGLFVAGVSLASVAPYVLPMRPVPDNGRPIYTLLQMNLLWNAGDRAEAIRRIAETRPDIITLQELTGDWREALAPLETSYPYQAVCLEADGFHGDSAILSRRPFVEGSTPICDVGDSLAAARIDLNGTAVTIASHHQLWPWPRSQWRRFDSAREMLAALPAPLILAGDFNAAGWSAFLDTYAKTTNTRVVQGIGRRGCSKACRRRPRGSSGSGSTISSPRRRSRSTASSGRRRRPPTTFRSSSVSRSRPMPRRPRSPPAEAGGRPRLTSCRRPAPRRPAAGPR